MMSAIAGDPTRSHLSPFSDELSKRPDVFVVDGERLIGAKTAHLTPKHRPATRTAFLIIAAFPARPCAGFPLCHELKLPYSPVLVVRYSVFTAVSCSASALAAAGFCSSETGFTAGELAGTACGSARTVK